MDFRILGPLQVERDGSPIALGMPRQRCLLALLLLRRSEVVDIDRLADQLWNGTPPRTARHTVQSYVHRLRQAFGDEASRLQTRAPGYRLACADGELDAERLSDLARRGHRAVADGAAHDGLDLFDAALRLWRGPPLADMPDLSAFSPERSRLEGLRLQIVEDRCEAQLVLGHDGVAEELDALTTQYPFRERLWRLLMIALYRAGRQAAALDAFRRARRLLADELGIEPGPELAQLEQRILRHDPTLQPVADPAGARAPAVELPAPRTSFVGRRRELDDLHGLLATRRLVTVIGPPGCGKTRVCIRAAAELRNEFPHGVRFVSLAEIDDPRAVPDAVASAVGVTVADRPSVDALADYVRPKRLLLVVDGSEHLQRGIGVLGELLDAAPQLRVLAASRTPLRLSGEHVYPLEPMPVPVLRPGSASPERDDADALTLFTDRARAVNPRFAVTADNAAQVAAVVARTAGLPLAVELAAARLRQFPVAELERRLDPALPMLTAGPIDAPSRHQTMRNAVAWSCELLDDHDRAVFRRLGVFRGGIVIDAAEAVVSEAPVDDVVNGVSRLVDAGLLQPPDDDTARYLVLEPLREFAIEQLREADEYDSVARRHADYYTELTSRYRPDPTNLGALRQRLERLDRERANLRAALRTLLATGDLQTALNLAALLWPWWRLRGHVQEGRRTLEDLLAHPAAMWHPQARGRALNGLAALCYWQGETAAAIAYYEEALATLDAASDPQTRADALLWFIVLQSMYVADHDEAERLLHEFEQLVEHDSALGELGDFITLLATGVVQMGRGEVDVAKKIWEQVLAITSQLDDLWAHAQVLRTLVGIDFARGRYADARDRLLECLAINWDMGDLVSVALDLGSLGSTEALTGRVEHGVMLAGAADRLRESVGGVPELPIVFGHHPDLRDVAGRSISDETYRRAWTRGRTMNVDDAVTAAFDGRPPTTAEVRDAVALRSP